MNDVPAASLSRSEQRPSPAELGPRRSSHVTRHFFLRLPALALAGVVRLYQRTVSPFLPAVFGPGSGCRFAPTCSHYAVEALQEHGAVIGCWLALRRLARCQPWHDGGFDPVPRRTPRCARATSHAA